MEWDLEKKKSLIDQKRREVPSHILQVGLNLLYIEPHDITERFEKLHSVSLIDLDDIFNAKNENVFIDISLKPYNEKLDNIGFAKQLRPELGIVVKDIILEEYQIFLNRIYQIDAIVFPISVLNKKTTEKIILITNSLGMLPIPIIESEADLKKLPKEFVKVIVSDYAEPFLKDVLILKFDDRGNLIKC